MAFFGVAGDLFLPFEGVGLGVGVVLGAFLASGGFLEFCIIFCLTGVLFGDIFVPDMKKFLSLFLIVALVSPAFGARKLAPAPKEEFMSVQSRHTQQVRADGDAKAAYILACAWMNGKVFNSGVQEKRKITSAYGDSYKRDVAYNGYLSDSEVQKEILSLLQRSADGGYPDAQYKLASMYEEEKDLGKALPLYQKAAAKGLVEACCKLGVFYMKGVTAKKYSSTSKPEYVLMTLEECKEGGSSSYTYEAVVPKNEQKALKYFAEGAKMNLPEANYQIGLCFENALGVPKNKIKAMGFYDKAAKAGHSEAQEALLKLRSE